MSAPATSPLSLHPLAGPPVQVFTLKGDTAATLGRLGACDVVLLDESVSRRHASLVRRDADWFVIDEGSAGGTQLNGLRIAPSTPVPVADGDLLRIGPWTFRIVTGAERARAASTIDDSALVRVQRAAAPGLDSGAEHRLRVLSECISRLNSAHDEAAAARIAVESALRGSGFARAAVLRRAQSGPAAWDMELVDSARADPGDARALEFSRTLLEKASAGMPVVLSGPPSTPATYGQSIAELGIHSALCVPLSLGGAIWGYLYLDARGSEARVRADAAVFCESLATAYTLSIASLRRAELERRQAELHAELHAAREVQELVMPPGQGTAGCLSFAVRSIPGSFVAGDFFDIAEIPGVGVAACLGDVSGHGVGAAILMAAAQSFLSAELERLGPGDGPASVVAALNRRLCRRPLAGRFISLWVGVLLPDGSLTYVDAGHGHWLHLGAEGAVQQRSGARSAGIPIGIEPGFVYADAAMTLGPGERIILYSDGITEQRGQNHEEFGTARLAEAVRGAQTPAEDVRRILGALTAFVGNPLLRDDATAASLSLLPIG
jgi:serine phosphatase RsbU (regulator of sigma subunit)